MPVSEAFEMLMGKARFSLKQLTEDEKKQGKRQDCSSKLLVESRLASRKIVKGRQGLQKIPYNKDGFRRFRMTFI